MFYDNHFDIRDYRLIGNLLRGGITGMDKLGNFVMPWFLVSEIHTHRKGVDVRLARNPVALKEFH